MKTYNFIACADLHLRDSIPHARTDDYWKAQEKKFRFLIDTANEKNCDIYCAGDFFHRAKSSSFLEAWIIEQLQDLKNEGLKFHVIPG
ncbi:MAG: metallophosphoesterase, partial [Melioribacteraceae bacterium]|nr:metallophosphoesterase [Melioribacteraceae bacterium]